MRMYSTSRWTLVLVLVALMTCLEMYFMATSWPVMVWTASGKLGGESQRWPDPQITHSLLFQRCPRQPLG